MGDKGIDKQPFELRVESPDVQAGLVLVDLPGLAAGNSLVDGPALEITEEYVKGRNAVIVVVQNSAIQDHDTVKAVSVANKTDTTRARTITVLNVMQYGEDDGQKVTKSSIASVHHFDSKSKTSPHALIAGGPKMGRTIDGIPADRQGVESLMARLSEMLWERAMQSLPEAQEIVTKRKLATIERLDVIGREPPPAEDKLVKLSKILASKFKDAEEFGVHFTPIQREFDADMQAYVPPPILSRGTLLTAPRIVAGSLLG